MRRDMELVRKILMKIASVKNDSFNGTMEIEGYDNSLVGYHLEIMNDFGLIDGDILYAGDEIYSVSFKLSWDGNEFLDSIESENIWNKIKSVAKDKGFNLANQSFDVVLEFAKMQTKQFLGIN